MSETTKALTIAARELARVLDLVDAAEEELRTVIKERKDRIAALRSTARELRDTITGKRGSQGVIAATLDAAAEVGRRRP